VGTPQLTASILFLEFHVEIPTWAVFPVPIAWDIYMSRAAFDSRGFEKTAFRPRPQRFPSRKTAVEARVTSLFRSRPEKTGSHPLPLTCATRCLTQRRLRKCTASGAASFFPLRLRLATMRTLA